MRSWSLLATMVFAASLLAGSVGTARSEDDAAALLAKHRAYVGWQFGDGTFRMMQLTGTVTSAAGIEKARDRWTTLQIGGIYRTTTHYGQYGFTGNVFWDTDDNGFTHPDYSDDRAFDVANSLVFGEATTLLTGTSQGQKPVGAASYPVVRVQPPHGDSIDLYVDPATGAYKRVVIDPNGSYETTYDIVSYADVVPGKKMISQWHVDGSTDLHQFTKIDPNVTIADADLHPPAQRATWTFANPNPIAVDVKRDGIYFDATINGVKGHFLLDTGASGIFIDDAFADRAHLKHEGRAAMNGAAGSSDASIRRADTIEIGGNTLANVVVYSGHYAVHREDINEQIDGLIGYPLFGGAVVTLNTSDQKLTIADPQTATIDPNAGYRTVVDLTDETPVVPMTIDGRVGVNALLDMGNSSFVMMSQDLVSRHHIPIVASDVAGDDAVSQQAYYQSHLTVEGADGQQENVRCSQVASIALGPIVYQNTFACVSPHMKGDRIVMGYDFMKQFDYVFDYRNGIVMMKPHPQ